MGELLDHLCKLNQSDIYPFHMPGHKRRRPEGISLDLFGMDITEIDGFDNLHHPTGILKETQEGAAELYGVLQTFFLVNGSTCGIQAAISASVRAGKKLLLARNCHKSVYNTCLLRSIDTTYVYPVRTQMEEVLGEIRAEDVKAALDADADIDAVIITSPNYDGVISDVERIADVVHEKGKLLIVDEAHGAHLPFADDFPKSAIRCGADIVIQSLHKTLPAPTQTALLHVASSRVDTAGLREFLAIYQTSSPSYVFMAAMQHCIEATYAHRKEWFETLSGRLDGLAAACADLHSLKLFSGFGQKPPGMYAHDKSKILIFSQNNSLNGEQLYEILLKRYHLQMEMASAGYVMGIATVSDTQEGFDRLAYALHEIDREIRMVDVVAGSSERLDNLQRPLVSMPMHKACDMEMESREIEQAQGCVCGEFLYLYPPGIPMIAPGEILTKELIGQILSCKKLGLPLQGIKDYAGRSIRVIRQQ